MLSPAGERGGGGGGDAAQPARLRGPLHGAEWPARTAERGAGRFLLYPLPASLPSSLDSRARLCALSIF